MLRRLLNSESKHRILIEKRIIRDKIKDQGSSDSNIVIPTAKDDVLENITNLVIKTINNIVIPTAKDDVLENITNLVIKTINNIVIPTAKDDVLENITNLVIKTINNIVIPTAKDLYLKRSCLNDYEFFVLISSIY